MRRFRLLISIGALLVFSVNRTVRADFDISPRVVGGQIATFGYNDSLAPAPAALTPNVQRVFDFGFEDPLTPHFTEDPGIHALASTSGYPASGLPNGSKVSFNILSNLQYWNGVGSVALGAPAGVTLRLELGSNLTFGGTGPGFYAGFIIGTVGSDGDQGIHVHLESTLNGVGATPPADGIYLMAMQLRLLQADGVTPVVGIAPSLPFYVLYDHGGPAGAIDDAVDYAQANLVPEPAACLLASLGGLLIFCFRGRRLDTSSRTAK